MSNILIRNIEPNLKRDIEKLAKAAGRSQSDEIKRLIRKGLSAEKSQTEPSIRQSAWEVWRGAFERAGLISDEFAEILDEIELERKTDFGRPPPDFE